MASLVLDATTADRMAALDPSMAALPEALLACSPEGPLALHDVRWSPAHGCRLAHLDGNSFVSVEVSGEDWSRHDWLDDPQLPALATAADPVEVARRLSETLGESVQVAITPVRYRPGSRAVLRYDVTSPSGVSTLFAKVLHPVSYERIAALHAELTKFGLADTPEAPVAEMVAWWPDLHVVVGRSVICRSASSMLGDTGVPDGDRVRLAHDLGDLLARFHAMPVAAEASWSPERQLATLTDALGAAEWADPAMGVRLGALVDTLAGSKPGPGADRLGHGSFRAGQVVVTPEGRPVLLDTDEVCRSEPERDLGVALANLTWQRIRQPENRSTLALAEQELRSGYADVAGELRGDALRWWVAAGLVQVAVRRYRRLELTSWPLVGALAAAAEDLIGTDQPNDTLDLLDVAQMSAVLTEAAGLPLIIETAETLGAAPGRRQVVRYETDSGPVVGKRFADPGRARLAALHLRLLADGPFRNGPYRVPAPLGLAGEHRVLFYREGQGTRLDTRLSDEGVRRAAGWLARLHTSDLQLPRTLSLTGEVKSTREWTEVIAKAHPSAAPAATNLLTRWSDAAMAPGDPTPAVPLHKDFHAGHVLLGDQTCVIDLDEARMGDPTFDVAHFCTYLFELGAPHSLTKVFLDEYAAATGWVDRGAYATFCAYTSLKIAKQAAVGSGPFRDVPEPRRLATVDAALTRGTAWLSTSWQGWA